jgi:8-oxo-dGTP diphosphatase
VLQQRALWSHQGGTWGLPGGARDSDETAVSAALREAGEEAGVEPSAVRPAALVDDDHGGWSYTTVIAESVGPVDPRPTGGESLTVGWVRVADLDDLPLHPGFAETWPRLRVVPPALILVVDAANVVGARDAAERWWRDRVGAARRLRDALVGLAMSGISSPDLPRGVDGGSVDTVLPQIVLVVEGAAGRIAADPPSPVTVLAAPGSGDDAIVDVVEAAEGSGDSIVVVTADRALRQRVSRHGAVTVGPGWLLNLLDR